MESIQYLTDRSLMWEIEDGKVIIAGVPTTSGMPIEDKELACHIRGIACTRVWIGRRLLNYILKFNGKSYGNVNITINWTKGYPLVEHVDFVRSSNY